MATKRPTRRVVLVTPPYHCGVVEAAGTWLNLAFVYIAGHLRAAGHDVVIYDAMSHFHDHGTIEQRLRELAPDVVASTGITATFPDAVEVLRTAKRLNPETVTVLGNVHATFMWEETLTQHGDAVDIVVRGEGELTLPELLACLAAGDHPARVRGIAYLEDGHPIATPPRPFFADLDALIPAWDLIEWPLYTYRPNPGSTLAVVSSSRGCGMACSFCSQQMFWERSWRARSPVSFVDELELLRERHGVDIVMLSDETPTQDAKRWRALLDELIARDLGTEILMETRADNILRDADIIDRYREAGIVHIYVGLESGRQENLDLFKKDLRTEQSRRAIELINGADIVSETSLIMGLPDETPETVRDTIEMAIHYDTDMAFFLAVAPWPYSELYPTLRDHIATTDYRRYNLVEPVVKPEAMSLEELNRKMDKAHMVFYMHKIMKLDQMSPTKRKFMISVLDILVHHSYLGEKMRGMAKHIDQMPPEMADIFRRLEEARESSPTRP